MIPWLIVAAAALAVVCTLLAIGDVVPICLDRGLAVAPHVVFCGVTPRQLAGDPRAQRGVDAASDARPA